jgi:hypothetical protein
MFGDPILTTWDGCPQSRLFADVVARADKRAGHMMRTVADVWDDLVAPRRLRRILGLQTLRFSPQDYSVVTVVASRQALLETRHHLAELYGHRRVRSNLAALGFLEAFETAIVAELERRAVPAASTSQGPPAPMPAAGRAG